jgi:nuclear pore complex protein Nup205
MLELSLQNSYADWGIDTLEMLLLLLWRHLAYYSDGHHHQGDSKLKASSTQAMRFLSTPEPSAFRMEVRKKLATALQRLASQDLVSLRFPSWDSLVVN